MDKLNRIKRPELIHILGLVAVIFFLSVPYSLPYVISDFWVTIVGEILIFGLFAASINFLFGYGGLLSFGQGVYFGMGAYGVALGVEYLGLSFWPAFFLGIIVATITAAIIGIFAVRLTWHYFAIITVIFSCIFFFVAVGMKDFTGGDDGLPFSVPPFFKVGEFELTLFNLDLQYYFILAIVSVCFLLFHIILRSPLGKAIIAVRENAERLSLIGFSPYKIRYITFVIAGSFGGTAGVLYALYARYATAHSLSIHLSTEGVVWMIVGGAGTFFGPMAGAALLLIIREELSVYLENYLLIVGVIVILTTVFMPQGIMGLIKKWLMRPKSGEENELNMVKDFFTGESKP